MNPAVCFANGIGNFILAMHAVNALDNPTVYLLENDRRVDAIRSICPFPVRTMGKKDGQAICAGHDRVFALWGWPGRSYPLPGDNVAKQKIPAWREDNVHECAEYAAFLGVEPKNTSVVVEEFDFPAGDRPVVTVANGSDLGASLRRIPAKLVIETAESVLRRRPDALFCYMGGPYETDEASYFVASIGKANAISYAGKLTMAQSAWAVSRSRALFTNDTSLMHVADSLKKRMVLAWGWTWWPKSRPWRLTTESPELLSVFHSAGGGCPHFPCFWTPASKACQRASCMEDFSVKNIADAILSALGD